MHLEWIAFLTLQYLLDLFIAHEYYFDSNVQLHIICVCMLETFMWGFLMSII